MAIGRSLAKRVACPKQESDHKLTLARDQNGVKSREESERSTKDGSATSATTGKLLAASAAKRFAGTQHKYIPRH